MTSSQEGDTLLHFGVRSKALRVVQILVAHGAKVTWPNAEGK